MPGGVEPSNLGKVFWPEAGVTKGDLLAYMEAVAPFVLPPLRGRPLTVVRFPDGITKSSFYQKDTPKYAPPWIRTVTLPAYGEFGSHVTLQLSGAGLTTSVFHIRKFGPHMYGTP